MAALTAASTTRENVGSLTLHIFTFTAVTGADTFSSGLANIISALAGSSLAGGSTTGICGVNANFVSSTGVITFTMDLAAAPVTLWVLSRT